MLRLNFGILWFGFWRSAKQIVEVQNNSTLTLLIIAYWRYEGVIYQKTQDPLNRDGKMCLYAPDVTVGPDGRFYLYYVLDHVSIVSVAVCDTPAGKYQFLVSGLVAVNM